MSARKKGKGRKSESLPPAVTPPQKNQLTEEDDEILSYLASIQIDAKIFSDYEKGKTDQQTYAKLYSYPNLLMLLKNIEIVERADPDKEDIRLHKARINFLKWIVIVYLNYPHMQQFMGWVLTRSLACQRPDHYTPACVLPDFFPKNWRQKAEDEQDFRQRLLMNNLPESLKE